MERCVRAMDGSVVVDQTRQMIWRLKSRNLKNAKPFPLRSIPSIFSPSSSSHGYKSQVEKNRPYNVRLSSSASPFSSTFSTLVPLLHPARFPPSTSQTALHLHSTSPTIRRLHLHAPYHIPTTGLQVLQGHAQCPIVEPQQREATQSGGRRGRPAEGVQGEIWKRMGCGANGG